MPNNLFSTYRQGENRVTATFLAILIGGEFLKNLDRTIRLPFFRTGWKNIATNLCVHETTKSEQYHWEVILYEPY